jgi:hypothetical protein
MMVAVVAVQVLVGGNSGTGQEMVEQGEQELHLSITGSSVTYAGGGGGGSNNAGGTGGAGGGGNGGSASS